MRNRIVAATLILAAGLGAAGAQSPMPQPPATTGDPLDANDPAVATAPKTPAVKGNGKAANRSDAKAAAKSAPVPATAGNEAASAMGGRNVTATGRTMPPTTGRAGAAPVKANTEADMLKAQKAAEQRNKAWDVKMRRTMSTICNGC